MTAHNELLYRLEAGAEIISLLRPFFTPGWTAPSAGVDDRMFSQLATDAAEAFRMLGQLDQSLAVHEAALQVDLKIGNLISPSPSTCQRSPQSWPS